MSPGLQAGARAVARPYRRRAPGVALAILVLVAAGCGGSGQHADNVLSAGDFRGEPGAVEPAPPSEAVVSFTPGTPQTYETMTTAQAREGINDVAILAGTPLEPGASAAVAGPTLTLDANVGQINGTPVYASEILGQLDNRLRAMRKQAKTNTAWQRQAAELIYGELNRKIQDELLLREAHSRLSPEQRAGLMQFLNRLRDNLASESGGSTMLADERLREESASSLEDKIREERDKELIAWQVSKVRDRVNVSWRDVVREYQRNHKLYNPPPKAVLRWIRVKASNRAGLDEVQSALAAGEPFEEVAARPANMFNPAEGGLHRVSYEGAFTEATIFGAAELNERATALKVGEVTGPFTFRGDTCWIKLDAIDQSPPRALEDLQLEIYYRLQDRRMNEEANRYLRKLMERGSFEQPQLMTERLLRIASERYLIEEPG